MEKKDLSFCNFADLIDQYIDQVGITKTCGDILLLLGNRLNEKAKTIRPLVSFWDDKEEDIYSEKDGISIKGMKDRELDSMPLGANHKSPSSFGAGAGSESAISRHPEGLTLVLEREYRK